MRPVPPPPNDGPAPSLEAQIRRDFGSMEDFRRILGGMLSDKRHGGYVWLVVTPHGRLRLVRTPPHVTPRGEILFRFPISGAPRPPRPSQPPRPSRPPEPQPPRPDWRDASDRYDRHMGRRPPYPMP